MGKENKREKNTYDTTNEMAVTAAMTVPSFLSLAPRSPNRLVSLNLSAAANQNRVILIPKTQVAAQKKTLKPYETTKRTRKKK